eukprot:scaffold40184_cov63-Phaeocystis_antarctica.AAC.2
MAFVAVEACIFRGSLEQLVLLNHLFSVEGRTHQYQTTIIAIERGENDPCVELERHQNVTSRHEDKTEKRTRPAGAAQGESTTALSAFSSAFVAPQEPRLATNAELNLNTIKDGFDDIN